MPADISSEVIEGHEISSKDQQVDVSDKEFLGMSVSADSDGKL